LHHPTIYTYTNFNRNLYTKSNKKKSFPIFFILFQSVAEQKQKDFQTFLPVSVGETLINKTNVDIKQCNRTQINIFYQLYSNREREKKTLLNINNINFKGYENLKIG
jgi:hypothetical protein